MAKSITPTSAVFLGRFMTGLPEKDFKITGATWDEKTHSVLFNIEGERVPDAEHVTIKWKTYEGLCFSRAALLDKIEPVQVPAQPANDEQPAALNGAPVKGPGA